MFLKIELFWLNNFVFEPVSLSLKFKIHAFILRMLTSINYFTILVSSLHNI